MRMPFSAIVFPKEVHGKEVHGIGNDFDISPEKHIKFFFILALKGKVSPELNLSRMLFWL